MRTLGLLLVIVGVGLSATFGSRLSPPEQAIATAEGRHALAQGPEPAAVTAGPGERLRAWAGVAGLPFLGGLVLVVAGAAMSRVAARQALSDDDGDDPSTGPVDFGALLAELQTDVANLAGAMPIHGAEEPAYDAARSTLEDLQREKLDRLIAAGPRLQLRYGLEAFAAVFSPLSTGERKLNRAWSALVDGHAPEATRSVAEAAEALSQAGAELAARQPLA